MNKASRDECIQYLLDVIKDIDQRRRTGKGDPIGSLKRNFIFYGRLLQHNRDLSINLSRIIELLGPGVQSRIIEHLLLPDGDFVLKFIDKQTPTAVTLTDEMIEAATYVFNLDDQNYKILAQIPAVPAATGEGFIEALCLFDRPSTALTAESITISFIQNYLRNVTFTPTNIEGAYLVESIEFGWKFILAVFAKRGALTQEDSKIIVRLFGVAKRLNLSDPKILIIAPAIDQGTVQEFTEAGIYHLFGLSMLRFFHLFVKKAVSEAKKQGNDQSITREFMSIFIPYGETQKAYSAEAMIDALTTKIKKK